jgi:hypothetical protein
MDNMYVKREHVPLNVSHLHAVLAILSTSHLLWSQEENGDAQ